MKAKVLIAVLSMCPDADVTTLENNEVSVLVEAVNDELSFKIIADEGE